MILDKINPKILALEEESNVQLKEIYQNIDAICLTNSKRILSAFIENKVAYTDFNDINGYANYDNGRDKLEKILASILGSQDALVRPQIMSGTNALYLALSALVKHGETILSISGKPYDTLLTTIGIIGNSKQSLISNGVKYHEIDLSNNDFNKSMIIDYLKNNKVKLIMIQRSRGYSKRKSLSIAQIGNVIKEIRKVDNEVIILVDNCYGELVETLEPGHVGANVVVGSLMKNLGGGIASTGGYISGDKKIIQEVSERFSAPGIGKDQGANFNLNNSFFKGLFLAPSVVRNALKTAIFTSYMLEKLGYEVSPRFNEFRTDIIQSVNLKDKDELICFAQGIQESSPIDSYVRVMPAPMPGYPYEEIMAAGTFTQGSTIELSADAPMKEPYTLFIQGALTFEYGKLGIMNAISKLKKEA